MRVPAIEVQHRSRCMGTHGVWVKLVALRRVGNMIARFGSVANCALSRSVCMNVLLSPLNVLAHIWQMTD